MKITIRSEVDSRLVLYPLIRALWNYGSVTVCSNNVQVKRLITEGQNFRNVPVIVDVDGTAESIFEDYQISEEACDFIILDNISTDTFDMCLVIRGLKSSAEFEKQVQSLFNVEGVTNVREIQFGTPVKQTQTKQRPEKVDKASQSKNKTEKEAGNNVQEDEYDPTKRVTELVGVQKVEKPKTFNIKFPSYEELERVEAEHKFPQYDANLISAFYDIFKDVLKVDANQFRKEVQTKDEYSGHIESV